MYFRPTRRRRINTRTIIIICAAAAAGVFALLFFLGVLPRFGAVGGVKALDFSLPDNVTANDSGLLYNQNDTLHLIQPSGEAVWSLNLDIAGATTETSKDLIVNYSGRAMQVMKFNKEQLFSTSLDNDIKRVAAGKGTVAVLSDSVSAETGENVSYLQLFGTGADKSRWEQISQIDSFGSSTKQVLDFGFHGDSDMFWVLSLDTSGVTPTSSITTFKPDGSPTTSIPINSEIVENVFVTDSSIFASGTNTLASYTYFSTKQAEQQIYGWKEAAASVEPAAVKLAYAPRSKSTEMDAARIYSTDLSMTQVRLPRNVFSLAVTQNKLYAITSETAYIYGMDGALERQLPLGSNMTRAKQISDKVLVLWDNQKSYIMEIS